jgi:hypothetical protein
MWSAIISAVASYLIPELLDQLDGSDYDNKYIEKALKQLETRSKEGYGADIISKMKRNINAGYGSQISAERAGTTQRLMRSDAPPQIREQILKDLTTSLEGGRMTALRDIDIKNEEAKMGALSGLMGGSLSAKQDTGWSELQGSLLGTVFNNLINKYTGNNNTTDINSRKLLSDYSSYGSDQNTLLGRNWATNRRNYYKEVQ